MGHGVGRSAVLLIVVAGALAGTLAPPAGADNSRLNESVVTNIYTIHRQAGCTERVAADPRLRLAAEWHANDLLGHRELDGHLGSDGSTPQTRAQAAGFPGAVAETVAINPAVAISGIEILNRWYYSPADFAIMSDCANTAVGVWSVNSPDRSVVVAVYGGASRGAA